jgi:hypothetical protein
MALLLALLGSVPVSYPTAASSATLVRCASQSSAVGWWSKPPVDRGSAGEVREGSLAVVEVAEVGEEALLVRACRFIP